MGTGMSDWVGFAGSVNAAEWAKIHQPINPGYVSGCAVTAGAGVRQVTVASGTVWALNGYGPVTGHTFSLAENTSGGGRIDYIVCDINYSTPDASLAVVQGTPAASASVPALTQTAGLRWQVPLATVHLESGETTLTSGDIIDRRLTPTYTWSTVAAVTATSSGFSITHNQGRTPVAGVASFTAGSTPLVITSGTRSSTSMSFKAWRLDGSVYIGSLSQVHVVLTFALTI